jgi:pilus assembly protein CpaD
MSTTTDAARRAGSVLAVAAAIGLALGGCRELFMSNEEALWLSTPTDRHAIGLRSAQADLAVELPPAGAGLSENQRADVRGFLDRYLAEGTGALRVSIPTAARDGGRGQGALREVAALAEEAGLDPRSLRAERHPARDGSAALQLSYPRREAVPPECADWSEDLGRNHQRLPHPNFGCATQRNLALNVADPRHLRRPATEQPRASEKRSADWSKYVGAAPGAGGGSAANEGKTKGPPKNQPAPVSN